jgi:hypothetical protein
LLGKAKFGWLKMLKSCVSDSLVGNMAVRDDWPSQRTPIALKRATSHWNENSLGNFVSGNRAQRQGRWAGSGLGMRVGSGFS